MDSNDHNSSNAPSTLPYTINTDGKRDKGFFRFKKFTLRHDLCGMKIGTDALLLAGYASLVVSPYVHHVWNNTPFIVPEHTENPATETQNDNEGSNNNHNNNIETHTTQPSIDDSDTQILNNKEVGENSNDNDSYWPSRILDIGTGSGVISIMLLQTYSKACIDSVDINEGAVRQATYNISQLPDDSWKKRIQVHHTPIQEYQPKPKSGHEMKYDLIVCAPPYFPTDPEIDPCVKEMDEKRRLARHTHSLQMSELVEKVRELITPEKGRFKVILSLPHPATEFLETAKNVGLHCLERVYVRDNPNAKVIRYMDTYYLPIEKIQPSLAAHSSLPPTQKQKPKKGNRDANKDIDVEREFSIHQKSFKEQSHVHRIYTNQYKWLLRDLCVHIFKEDDYYTSQPKFIIKIHEPPHPFRFEYLPCLQYLS
eukprot:TRINITY_DN2550_c0_g1_i1.p1 TRINITY_DN2550_c0_g1~~TRINITY_DN2550_c0_g1_i1.p1  ORF type:complete len:425 (+),score=88.37 TRINITY_DN2550_c0_g1_i1:214-1488(+)